MPENKLLPCPFCASQPYYGGYPDIRIECLQCKQSIVKVSWYNGDLGTMEAAWNTRAPDPKVEGLLRALNPRLWTKEMDNAYHQGLPDIYKAFENLRNLALKE